jgi:hypothetical protein
MQIIISTFVEALQKKEVFGEDIAFIARFFKRFHF